MRPRIIPEEGNFAVYDDSLEEQLGTLCRNGRVLTCIIMADGLREEERELMLRLAIAYAGQKHSPLRPPSPELIDEVVGRLTAQQIESALKRGGVHITTDGATRCAK